MIASVRSDNRPLVMQDSLLTLMLQSVAGLAVVLALFGLLVWIMKRLQQQRHAQGGAGSMRIVQRFGIDAKHSVIELAHGGKSYLIGLSPGGMTTIASLGEEKSTAQVRSIRQWRKKSGDGT